MTSPARYGSHARGTPSRRRRFGASAVALAEAEAGSEAGARERACRGDRRGEAPRTNEEQRA